MDQSAAIIFKSVTKQFRLQQDRTFKELIPSLLLNKTSIKKLTVLSDVSFQINVGETVGIVGRNGSGKSTVLKLIAGVTSPTHGQIIVNGKVSPLIELGAGFHHELTGYENIFLNAALLGLHKKDIESKLDQIIEFSELADFIHTPVKRYSTGMYMKLGFAIAIHADAPILLIDEVLAVGDTAFQKKCLDRLRLIKRDQNKTIIFVSHDENAVKSFCERAILLSDGKIISDDTPSQTFKKYHSTIDL